MTPTLSLIRLMITHKSLRRAIHRLREDRGLDRQIPDRLEISGLVDLGSLFTDAHLTPDALSHPRRGDEC